MIRQPSLLFIIAIFFLIIPLKTYSQNSIVDLLSLKKPSKESLGHQMQVLKKWNVQTEDLYNINDAYIDSVFSKTSQLDTTSFKDITYTPI